MNSPQNIVTAKPSLSDVLDTWKKDTLLSLFCHGVGTIQSYNPLLQTAVVTMNYPKTIMIQDPITGLPVQQVQNYPIVADCPVIFPQGGGFAFTFPILPGDTCVLLFNDRSLDDWLTSNNVVPISSNRLHSFSDAMVFVGLNSFKKPLLDVSTTSAELRGNTVPHPKVGVNLAGLVVLQNDLANMNLILNNILGALTGIIDPTTQAAIVVQINALFATEET